MKKEKKGFPAGRIIGRIAAAWEYSIILEMHDELRTLSLHQRAVAIEFIYERCLRYASENVKKLLEKENVQREISENPEKQVEFLILSKYLQSGKYLKRIIGQLRKLIPKWQDANFFNLHELYQELYPRKESLGEHEGCSGQIIVSGSYYRCRKCKTVAPEISETPDGTIILMDGTALQK